MGDLIRNSVGNNDTVEESKNVATTPNASGAMNVKRTKESEERILRHHEKIIRAKNINHKLKQQQLDQNEQQSSDKLPATTDLGVDDEDVGVSGEGGNSGIASSETPTTTDDATATSVAPSPASNVATNAVPPPQLVSALRQIFGSASSTNLEDLMAGGSADSDDMSDKRVIGSDEDDGDQGLKLQHSENVNVLPSLLAAVLNHETFVGTPTSSSSTTTERPSISESEAVSQIKRDLKNFFRGEFDDDDEDNDETSVDNDGGIGEGTTTPIGDKEKELQVSMPPAQLPPGAANMEAIIGSVCKSMRNKSVQSSPTKSHVHGVLIAILSILTGCLLSEEDLENLGPGEDSHMLLQHQHLPASTLDAAGNSGSSFLQVGAVLSMLRSSSHHGDSNIVKNHDKNVIDEFSLDEKLLNYFADASSIYEERIEIQKANLFCKPPTPEETKSGDEGETGDKQVTPDVLPPLVGRVSDSSDESDRDETDVDQSDVRIEEGNDIPIFDEGDDEDHNSSESDEEHDEGNSRASRNSDIVQEGINDQHGIYGGDDDSENNANNDDDDEESMLLRQALALSLAAAIGGSGITDESDADEGGNASIATPPILAPLRDLEDSDSSSEQCEKLPPLPTPPPLSLLPTHDDIIMGAYEEDDDENEAVKSNSSQSESFSVYDPSALSSFGNLPASQVLLHLQSFVLDMMQNSLKGVSGECQSVLEIMSPGGMGSPFFGSQTPTSRRNEGTEQDAFDNDFAPDSITASLLFASLHLSNYLRNAAVAMLSDIVQDPQEMVEEYSPGVHDICEQDIKIANSNESEDPLTDIKDDPAIGATLDSFESKGMQRKAAAAAHFATLRHETKQKLVLLWSKKVSLYSSCCLLGMRCLRIFMGRCIQKGMNSSSIEDAVCMSTRTRLGLAAILSNFYSSSTSSSFEHLHHSIGRYSEDYKAAGGGPKNQFLVSSLCSEAILLWGASLSFLYPDHTARVDLLSELSRNSALPSAKSLIDLNSFLGDTQNICRWSDLEIQRTKLDLLCKRLRMSDMLDCFIVSPMLSFGEDNDLSDNKATTQESLQAYPPNNSVAVISLLGDAVKNYSRDDDLTQLYLAVCNRAMSNLILWQNLSISSNDENDHDISGGEVSTTSSEPWANALQLSLNSSKFHFDSTKCADSIAIVSSASSPGVTANQRATKVWGTVLSTACFPPKSGIHRWAIKLEKCERGHVFVGVATSSASTKTYVGGDKHGWGLIGTQALWHDRNKIRSDYGSIFRSGATIVMTLDTNVGTLRFGLWKEAAGAESGPLSPSHGTAPLTSPRVGANPGSGVSMIEDWGIAFEGLPLDVKLYPAVGLYQRDDKATLFAVTNPTKSSSGKTASSAISSGEIYFPSPLNVSEETPDYMLRVQQWNQSLCTDGIAFSSEVLSRSIKLLSSFESTSSLESNVLLTSILPSLASSICLIPSCIPTLSTKYAIALLPLVTRCAKLLDRLIPLENKSNALGSELKEGNWLLRIEQQSESRNNNISEEYVVCLKLSETSTTTGFTCFQGEGVDTNSRSKDGAVKIIGACCGTHLHLIEDWSDVSPTSCIIDARLGLDGTKFEGIYHDTKQHTSGKIFGCLQDNTRIQASTSVKNREMLQMIESLLCMAIGHLSLILCSKTSLSDVDRHLGEQANAAELQERQESFRKVLSASSIIAGGRLDYNSNCVRTVVDSLVGKSRFTNTIECEGGDSVIIQHWQELVASDMVSSTKESSADTSMHIEKATAFIDYHFASQSQCSGSFSRLCPDEYSVSQRKIASVIMYHSCGCHELDTSIENSAVLERAVNALSTSRQILEDGIRDALSRTKGLPLKQVCKIHCSLASDVADFIVEFPCVTSGYDNPSLSVFDDTTLIFNSIKSKEDLGFIRRELDSVTEKSIMRYLGLRSLYSLLAGEIKLHSAIESAIVSLPRLLRRPVVPFEAHRKRSMVNGFSSIHSGCSVSVQKCITASVKLLCDRVGVYLEEATQQKSSSLVLSLLANFSTVSYPHDMEGTISQLISCIGDIIVHCREEASLCDGDDSSLSATTLVSALRRRSAHCLLQVAASVSLTLTAQLSGHQISDETTNLVGMSSDLLLREMSEMIPVVRESVSSRRDINTFKAMKADWRTCKNLPTSPTRSSIADTKTGNSSPGLSYLLSHNYMMASNAASTEPMSSCYLSHLINTLHVAVRSAPFIKSMKQRSKDWFSMLFSFVGIKEDEHEAQICHYLNPKLRRRIMRLLRLLLIETDADPVIIRYLFRAAAIVGSAAGVEPSDFATNDSAVSLLRYIYAFSDTWRQIINEVIGEEWKAFSESEPSSELRSGVLSFLGGAPGYLTKGSFVVIKPSLASSSSTVSTKVRASSGGTSSLNFSTGNGINEIVSGLSRNVALAGILSSVDLKSGSCEVVVVGNRDIEESPKCLPSAYSGASKMTIRAVRVNVADISFVYELPLLVHSDLPTDGMYKSLLNRLKAVSESILSQGSTEQEECSELVDADDMFTCAMSLRSTTVLTSNKEIVHDFVSAKEGCFKEFLAVCLQVACPDKTKPKGELSSLSSLEALAWHLLSVRSTLLSRREVLNSAEPSKLKSLFGQDEESEKPNAATDRPNTRADSSRTPSAMRSFLGSLSEGIGSTAASRNTRDEEESDSAADRQESEDSHLREAAIVQMAELGLPRQWAELALRRVGGTNIEAAVHFCLERGGEMERLLAEDHERRGSSSVLSSSRRRGFGSSRMDASNLIRQLVEMGFPRRWCVEALSATRNNVDEALTWILTNGERLSAEDEAAEEEEHEDDEDDEEGNEEEEDDEEGEEMQDDESVSDENVEPSTAIEPSSDEREPSLDSKKPFGWSGSLCPVRFVSGRSSINPQTLEITGLPSGGFSSVGTKGVLLTSGKWYYEAEIQTAGCIQIGWADSSFAGHCQADRGDGVGDGPSSWAFDGWRRYRWHSTPTEWGCRWAEGDVVGCLVDMDSMAITFTLNGKGEEIGMGLAFSGEGFRPCSGVYACVSFNRKEKIRLILGGEGSESFKFSPPEGYRGVGEAIHDAVKEMDNIMENEKILDDCNLTKDSNGKRYMCDFSDGEHGHELFAWQHRYYGADASVHLGASRAGLRGGSSLKSLKSGSSVSNYETPVSADIASRLAKVFSDSKLSETNDDEANTLESNVEILKTSYGDLLSSVEDEFKEVCTSLCVLYAQKLVMHTMVSCSDTFSLNHFLPEAKDTPWTSKNAEEEVSRTLWKVIEHCTSLRSSGWVGEAGAMAVAAEALGLGISTYDNTSTSTAPGLIQVGDQITIPCGGTVQFLSSALFLPNDVMKESFTCPSLTYAACSEVALGSDAGGYLSFARSSLQNAAVTSSVFRDVLVAAVRRAVRLIAAAEFDSDEHSSEDDISELASPPNDRKRLYSEEDAPDARLASFLTGLLLSEPVKRNLVEDENTALRCSLFEGWCVGLLSPSPPWRMVSALTAAGILSTCPVALSNTIRRVPVLARYFSRLESTVARRQWAERAAAPICSRYSHALIELLSSVKRSIRLCEGESPLGPFRVDAATPLPLVSDSSSFDFESWEWNDGWISSNAGWETWTGFVDIMEVEWKPPSRSIVRTLMDGGEGPPLLREGCTVVRGSDWDSRDDTDNEDGKDEYDKEKLAKEEEKRAADEDEKKQKGSKTNLNEGSEKEIDPAEDDDPANDEDPADYNDSACQLDQEKEELPELSQKESDEHPSPSARAASSGNEADDPNENKDDDLCDLDSTKKKKKLPTPKLPTGTVMSIEPWEGIPAMARRVRWHRTGKEGLYRYGGNGGRFDLVHVETNDKNTRVRKRHPPPESLEQCAARYGFGKRRKSNVILRLSNRKNANADNTETCCEGIMEWPDFGAGVLVECTIYSDGAVAIKEKRLLYGSKDSGWETRFGQPSYVPGTEFVVLPTMNEDTVSSHEELLGDSTFVVKDLRKKEDGGRVRVTSELHLYRGKGWKVNSGGSTDASLSAVSPMQSPLIRFDSEFHASSFSLSKDKRTVTCVAADGRGMAYGNVGFTKGVHYWEVKLEKAEIGSVYIGVAEKPESTSGGFETQPRLNRWLGWGFVNFRATYSAGVERVYGAHCHAGDTVGVLLDCDAGRISYFFDGVKYGEHILNDLGCAFENVSPFGFNADGCGSGGAGQGAPSGVDGGRNSRYSANGAVRPKAMWPVIGLRHPGDRVTLSGKFMTSHGIDALTVMKNSLAVDEILCAYEKEYMPRIPAQLKVPPSIGLSMPPWFVKESLQEYNRWRSGRWLRTATRGSGQYRLSSYGLDVDLDTSPFACAAACASLGLPVALLCGDRVDVKRSSGRILELQEEAVVLGAYQGRLFYRLVSQKSEGGSLMEGGGRAWFWDESETVEGGLQLIGEGRGRSVVLPKLNRFNPVCGGLKVVYNGGAVGKLQTYLLPKIFLRNDVKF